MRQLLKTLMSDHCNASVADVKCSKTALTQCFSFSCDRFDSLPSVLEAVTKNEQKITAQEHTADDIFNEAAYLTDIRAIVYFLAQRLLYGCGLRATFQQPRWHHPYVLKEYSPNPE